VLTQRPEWKIPFSSNMEEALESTGGFLLMLAPIAVRFAAGQVAAEQR
jgi:hypothetical protein